MKRIWCGFLLLGVLQPAALGQMPDQEAQKKEIQRIRELRLEAQQFQGNLREQTLRAALAQMDLLMTKEAWAKNNLEAIKEQIQIIEDMGAYGGQGGAILRWDTLMKKLYTNTPEEREQYFDCYYHLNYCFSKNALKNPPPPRWNDTIRHAAQRMVKLEGTQPDMGSDAIRKKYVELLKTEPLLKAAYQQAGGSKLIEAESMK